MDIIVKDSNVKHMYLKISENTFPLNFENRSLNKKVIAFIYIFVTNYFYFIQLLYCLWADFQNLKLRRKRMEAASLSNMDLYSYQEIAFFTSDACPGLV